MPKRIGSLVTAFIACAGSLVVASGTLSTSASAASNNTDITFALPPAIVPNYIFPIMGAAYYSNVNLYQFQQEMFRPLYWFGKGSSPTLDESLSLADAPTYSNSGKTVTIKLKKYKWSDGTAVNSEERPCSSCRC